MKNLRTPIENTIRYNVWANCRTNTMEAMFSLSENTFDIMSDPMGERMNKLMSELTTKVYQDVQGIKKTTLYQSLKSFLNILYCYIKIPH